MPSSLPNTLGKATLEYNSETVSGASLRRCNWEEHSYLLSGIIYLFLNV